MMDKIVDKYKTGDTDYRPTVARVAQRMNEFWTFNTTASCSV